MKFVKYDGELPRRKYHTKINSLLTEFINMNVKSVKLEFKEGEYKSVKSCRDTFAITAKRNCYPVCVRMIKGEVYLTRTDM